MCKPHKMQGENRWNHKDEENIKIAEKLKHDFERIDLSEFL